MALSPDSTLPNSGTEARRWLRGQPVAQTHAVEVGSLEARAATL